MYLYSELPLLDYFYLENVIRFSDSISRDKVKRVNHQHWKRGKQVKKREGKEKAAGNIN